MFDGFGLCIGPKSVAYGDIKFALCQKISQQAIGCTNTAVADRADNVSCYNADLGFAAASAWFISRATCSVGSRSIWL